MIFRGNPCWNSNRYASLLNPKLSPRFSALPWFIFSRSTYVRKHVVARLSGDDVDHYWYLIFRTGRRAPILTARCPAAGARLRVGQLAKAASAPAPVLPWALKPAHDGHDLPLAGLRRRRAGGPCVMGRHPVVSLWLCRTLCDLAAYARHPAR